MSNFDSNDIRSWFANNTYDDQKLNNFMRQNRSKQHKSKVITSFIEAEKLLEQKTSTKDKDGLVLPWIYEDGLYTSYSSVPGSGLGLFCLYDIPAGTCVGVYDTDSKITDKQRKKIKKSNPILYKKIMVYAWGEHDEGKCVGIVNPTCKTTGEMTVELRKKYPLVNAQEPAKHQHANLYAISFYPKKGTEWEIGYISARYIKAHEELCIYYGDKYDRTNPDGTDYQPGYDTEGYPMYPEIKSITDTPDTRERRYSISTDPVYEVTQNGEYIGSTIFIPKQESRLFLVKTMNAVMKKFPDDLDMHLRILTTFATGAEQTFVIPSKRKGKQEKKKVISKVKYSLEQSHGFWIFKKDTFETEYRYVERLPRCIYDVFTPSQLKLVGIGAEDRCSDDENNEGDEANETEENVNEFSPSGERKECEEESDDGEEESDDGEEEENEGEDLKDIDYSYIPYFLTDNGGWERQDGSGEIFSLQRSLS